jgi:ABC-type uncharacterized transport system permease subunit
MLARMEIVAYVATALLYGGLAAYSWRTQWVLALPQGAPPGASRVVEHYAVIIPLALHGMLLGQDLFAPDGLRLGFATSISAIAWLTVVIYWVASIFHRLEGLQALVLPLAAVSALLPVFFPPPAPLASAEHTAFRLHLLISLLAYSLFTIASLHVLLMAVIERRLHDARVTHMLQRLPPLLTMEALLFRIIWAGFILLTLSLASGVVFSEEVFGKPAPFTHKTIFGVLSWLIFAALLGGRRIYGWRGRMAVRWTLAGFLTLVLAYIGSRFVLEVILGRG